MSQKAFVYTGSVEPTQWGEVVDIAIPEVPANKILVRAVAYAANPTDWKHVALGWGGQKGCVIGSDVAGYVEKVGDEVTGFKPGDKVAATLHGGFSSVNGGFQEYVVLDPVGAVSIDGIDENKVLSPGKYAPGPIDSFEAAVSAPLSSATAALSMVYNLGIPLDTEANKEDYILIWGGATAAGIYGIQIAKKVFGINVITTASKKHHQYLTLLGADIVVDYHDSDAVDQIRAAGNGRIHYAVDNVSEQHTWQAVYDATAGSSPVALDNLLFLGADELNTDPARTDVKIVNTVVYRIEPVEVDLLGRVFPIDPEMVRAFGEFSRNEWPALMKLFVAPGLVVLKPGLASANDALDYLNQDKTTGEKVVWRLK